MRGASVVLATGGLSLPKTGSDGGGLTIARALGHTIVPTTPALAPLVLAAPGGVIQFAPGPHPQRPASPRSPLGPNHERLSGVAQDLELALRVNGRITQRITGAMLWTHFGISGPAALDMSRHWLRARLDNHEVTLTAQFRPGESFESVEAAWTRSAGSHPRLGLQSALAEMLPGSVAVRAPRQPRPRRHASASRNSRVRAGALFHMR